MLTTDSPLERNIESVSKIAAFASKFGVLVGGVCVIAYSLRINHFPQGLSVGDGVLFIMAAACFGVIYVLFIFGLVALGVFMSPGIRVIVRFIARGIKVFRKRTIVPIYSLAPFSWFSVVPAFISVVFIAGLGKKDSIAFWNLPLLSVALYFFYSIYTSSASKIKDIATLNNSILHTKGKEYSELLGDPEILRSSQLFSITMILIIPLCIGGVSGQLLDATMRLAHVRIEKSVIYVKEPYASLLPKTLIAKSQNTLKDYVAYDGTIVLFKGFGKTTVIYFQDGIASRKLEIPNDQLIIEER